MVPFTAVHQVVEELAEPAVVAAAVAADLVGPPFGELAERCHLTTVCCMAQRAAAARVDTPILP